MVGTDVKHFFAKLKTCSESEINTYFIPILELFPLLPGKEKNIFAAEFYQWARENAIRQPLKIAVAVYMAGLADFFTEKYDHALTLFNDAQKLFEDRGNNDEAMLCVSMCAAIYRTFGDVDLALNGLWESYEQLTKTGLFAHNIMACSFQLASIYAEGMHYDEALPLFEKTLTSAKKLGNQIFVVNSLQGLGKLYLMLGKYNEAKEQIENGLAEAEHIASPMFIANLLTELANYYFETGDYDNSANFHTKALFLRQQHNAVGGSITNLIQLAAIYAKQNKEEDVEAALLKGLELAKQINTKPKIYKLHRLLADFYERQNELKKSLYHFRLFYEIREQVNVEDTGKRIKHLKMVFEAEQTKKENAIIKQQKTEIEKKNADLQETIDELTRTRVGKKAKILTLAITIVLFTVEEIIIHSVLHLLPEENLYLSFIVKMIIIFMLKPIDSSIEHHLLTKIIKKQKVVVVG